MRQEALLAEEEHGPAMAVTVKIPSQLRAATDGEATAEVDGSTVGEVLDSLYDRYEELRDRIDLGTDLGRFRLGDEQRPGHHHEAGGGNRAESGESPQRNLTSVQEPQREHEEHPEREGRTTRVVRVKAQSRGDSSVHQSALAAAEIQDARAGTFERKALSEIEDEAVGYVHGLLRRSR